MKATRLSPKEFEQVSCALCGRSDSRLLARKGQFGWPTYVSICKNCGLVYLNPRWTIPGYAGFYASEYDQFYRFDEEQAREKEQRKAKIVWERLSRYTPDQFRSALDIGCGLGWAPDYFSQQVEGLSIAGIEPSDYCAAHFVNQIGGKLIAKDVDTDWHLANQGKYDLITLRHVLEHLLDPYAVLIKIHQALSLDGSVYIAVPDMMHPDGSLADFWYRCVHAYYYSADTLGGMAARAGLKPIVIKEEKSELWGIFRKGEAATAITSVSVYKSQLRSLGNYKRRRAVRSILRFFSPQKVSWMIPRRFKNAIPKRYKDKFRHLVYRH